MVDRLEVSRATVHDTLDLLAYGGYTRSAPYAQAISRIAANVEHLTTLPTISPAQTSLHTERSSEIGPHPSSPVVFFQALAEDAATIEARQIEPDPFFAPVIYRNKAVNVHARKINHPEHPEAPLPAVAMALHHDAVTNGIVGIQSFATIKHGLDTGRPVDAQPRNAIEETQVGEQLIADAAVITELLGARDDTSRTRVWIGNTIMQRVYYLEACRQGGPAVEEIALALPPTLSALRYAVRTNFKVTYPLLQKYIGVLAERRYLQRMGVPDHEIPRRIFSSVEANK